MLKAEPYDRRNRMAVLRDRLWLFSVAAGCDDTHYGTPISRITPVEAAWNMGIPNVMVIVDDNRPILSEQYLMAMRPLKQVVWSIVDSGAATGWADGRETDVICEYSKRFPNVTGVYMDDFFNKTTEAGEAGVMGTDKLTALRQQLAMPHRILDLWVVLYTHQADMDVSRQLALCDYVSYWTWHARDIPDMPTNLEKLEALGVPPEKISLGLYMWDYGGRKELSVDLMKQQCEMGLEWLRQGRINNLSFLGSYLADLGLEAVEWTIDWIRKVGDQEIPD